jgi:anti-sigma B factor antagonist
MLQDSNPAWTRQHTREQLMALKAGTSQSNGFPVLFFYDELDLAMKAEINTALDGLDAQGDCLIVDLSDVRFIDSSSIGALIAFGSRLAERGGTLAVASDREDLRRLFRTRGLVELLNFFDSQNEAAAFLKSSCGEAS